MKDKFELAKEFVNKTFKNVEVSLEEDSVDGNPGIVIDKFITIWPEKALDIVVTLNCSKIVDVIIYNVDATVDIPGSRYEPPSVDVVELGKSRYFQVALELALTASLKNDLQNFFDNKSWEAYATELESEKDQRPALFGQPCLNL